ncbi:MAG: M20/M25/M40 family metallo-hydrolase [Ignavibacteria bacterium]|nr:M20/M25/M40 family metallo-hydrolase [Ignavibacteria bacterium]
MAVEKVDTAVISKIKDEGMNRSQVMEILSDLCDIYGPRLSWSPEYRRAGEWAAKKLTAMGLQNVHFENHGPVGKGWTLKKFAANVTEPYTSPLIAYPAAWTPGVRQKEVDALYLDAEKTEDLDKFKGQLKGKCVLLTGEMELQAHFEPHANRLADSVLLAMANAGPQAPSGRRPRRMVFPRLAMDNFDSVMAFARQMMPGIDSARVARMLIAQQSQRLTPQKLEFAQKEGALAVLTPGRGDGGTFIVSSAMVPQPGQAPFDQRVSAYSENAPAIVPQIVVAAEHYNRMVRTLKKGHKVKLEMNLEVVFTKADSCFNIIAEIPGTDLKDEIVMLGGHFDTWHAGTGATDDGTGVAACMEAVRILKTLNLQPRRTIRVGLWGAEEQGLIGSRAYVAKHFAEREGGMMEMMMGGGTPPKTKPEYDKFSVYFNHDNGTGKIRGVYMQGNEAARTIFREWLASFSSMGASTLTLSNTSGTDHLSFDGVGLPGFQFIQDPVEYDTRTHHYNMDVYERVQPEDMKQAATIMAAFAYNAAMMEQKFPRKPMQDPRPAATGRE